MKNLFISYFMSFISFISLLLISPTRKEKKTSLRVLKLIFQLLFILNTKLYLNLNILKTKMKYYMSK